MPYAVWWVPLNRFRSSGTPSPSARKNVDGGGDAWSAARYCRRRPVVGRRLGGGYHSQGLVVSASTRDTQVRLAAFAFLDDLRVRYRDIVPHKVLARGFDFQGTRMPLLSRQGIFKPKILELPLTFATAPEKPGRPRPYDDAMDEQGVLRYRYRGSDPNHYENAGLRRAMIQRTPLIYLFGVVVGQYLPVYPVFIVEDHPEQLYFGVAVDDRRAVPGTADLSYPGRHDPEDVRRRYITVVTRARLHQAAFRERVLAAYRRICAICRLRHSELLEAAHILPDGHSRGLPIVPNGLALCSLHHAAFDAHILGVTPDYEVRVRTDVLREEDGRCSNMGSRGSRALGCTCRVRWSSGRTVTISPSGSSCSGRLRDVVRQRSSRSAIFCQREMSGLGRQWLASSWVQFRGARR